FLTLLVAASPAPHAGSHPRAAALRAAHPPLSGALRARVYAVRVRDGDGLRPLLEVYRALHRDFPGTGRGTGLVHRAAGEGHGRLPYRTVFILGPQLNGVGGERDDLVDEDLVAEILDPKVSPVVPVIDDLPSFLLVQRRFGGRVGERVRGCAH